MITRFTCRTRTSNTIWDIRELANNIKWTLDMNFSAGSLTFDLLEVQEGFVIKNGDVISLYWDKKKIFYGYVFKVSYTSDEKFSVTAYDALRYFKNQDSLVMPISTVSQRFEKVAKMANVKYKTLSSASYKLPAEVFDNKSYFDMVSGGIQKTKRATEKHFFLFANFNVVELRKYPYKQLKLSIGDKSMMESFTLERSIENMANVVRVVREDKKKKGRTSSTADGTKSSLKESGHKTVKRSNRKSKVKKKSKATRSATNDPKNTSFSAQEAVSKKSIERVGKLVFIEKAKDKANPSQMKERAKKLLKQKNKQETSLKVTAIGNTDLVVGNSVIIKAKSLNEVGIGTKQYLINKATHYFDDYDYHVDLELRI
ncbi:XkdQ/YqbQ family protein [Apilactobacillus xinyiensis]|uniref:XkdQ/YqbQ family protein n=1 Tax=Apilactobacillus xinyiensis TaxID=2841032 RepID=UPI00200F1374|nr:hypothetical protein [Apilactobacillus xinyiensis]MCL0330618.1 hypothetical protein [Apilactobacillus xinyiensis]